MLKLKSLLLSIKEKIEQRRALRSTKSFVSYYRNKGIKIGENLVIKELSKGGILIDTTRPSLVEIGDNVRLNRNFTLLTHDFVTAVFLNKYGSFLSSSGKVKIGNNVAFGMDCMVLKGVTIGDNCFIGAGSIVSKDIPANSLAIGRPAKVICSIEEYHKRRITESLNEALLYAKSIEDRFGRMPLVSDFWEEFPLFVDAENMDQYPSLPYRKQLGSHLDDWKKTHKRMFPTFKAFLEAAGVNTNN